TDFEGIAKAVEGGIDLALVDSTNAERPGRAQSERVAGEGLAAAFAQAPRRIILTTFSSHVARISQSLDAAFRLRRSAAFLGRSMRSVVEIAQRLRRLSLPGGPSIGTPDPGPFPPGRLPCWPAGRPAAAHPAP